MCGKKSYLKQIKDFFAWLQLSSYLSFKRKKIVCR